MNIAQTGFGALLGGIILATLIIFIENFFQRKKNGGLTDIELHVKNKMEKINNIVIDEAFIKNHKA